MISYTTASKVIVVLLVLQAHSLWGWSSFDTKKNIIHRYFITTNNCNDKHLSCHRTLHTMHMECIIEGAPQPHCYKEESLKNDLLISKMKTRRALVLGAAACCWSLVQTKYSASSMAWASDEIPTVQKGSGNTLLKVISDPETYSALVYTPPQSKNSINGNKYPILLVLHGAAKNERDIWNLADIQGEHSGLPPSLISAGIAPSELTDNFVVVAPYVGQGKQTFYTEPRRNLLNFVNFITGSEGEKAGGPSLDMMDTAQIYILGFSDGATLGVELLTSPNFAGGIIASYGFTGSLPALALERLKDKPMWIFHSKDDVIFPIRCSDQLVQSLRQVNYSKEIVKYSRFEKDPEGFTGPVRGHTMGITASKMPETYQWLLNLPLQ